MEEEATQVIPPDLPSRVAEFNRRVRDAAHACLPWATTHPIALIQWIHVDQVQANDYNPNAVAQQEMRLLHTSISEDGYTQPVVTIFDPTLEKYVIVDGYHRYTVMRRFPEVYATTGGYLPVVVIDKSPSDRMAATIRHNRARGKHSITGMGNLVFQMLREGTSDVDICNKLGLEPEELLRLKHITGYSKLYRDHTYSRPVQSTAQMQAKADYKREHPDEAIPNF